MSTLEPPLAEDSAVFSHGGRREATLELSASTIPVRPGAIGETFDPGEPQKIGRYVVIGKLGEGAMGVVYRAYDAELDRQVALKLLRRGNTDESYGRGRLHREAQSMARLSHPNVVQVYDVGEYNGLVFVALELVQGLTLRSWLLDHPRSWQEVREVFVQAGRGLAAAHAAGIVHRDFKPENVLIGRDGRARVADFGLARPAGLEADMSATAHPIITSHLTSSLTDAGTLIGTPAYMAPEQFMRQTSDARSDQFSFCVALYEALYGHRPFGGRDLEELSRSVLRGQIGPPPERTRVPPWLFELLRRGLSSGPDHRYPSMDALLRDLTREGARERARVAWIVGLTALALGSGFALASQQDAECRGGADHLVGVWDAGRRAEVERALLATKLEFAADTAARVREQLDGYTKGWIAMHGAACTAYHRGEQSQRILDLRMLCLERKRAELASLVALLASADETTAINAAQASASLSPLAECADAAMLDEQGRLGVPQRPADAPQLEALELDLIEAKNLEVTGQYERGLQLATRVAQGARAQDHPPLLAEALLVRGKLLEQTGAYAEADRALWDAYVTAVAADHERLQAHALVWIVWVSAHGARDFAAAERAGRVATALVARVAPDTDLDGHLRSNLAVLRQLEGRFDEAEAYYRSSLALRQKILPSTHRDIAVSLSNLGTHMDDLRRYAEAEGFYRRALAVIERAAGPQHPHSLVIECNLAVALVRQGRHGEGRRLLEHDIPLLAALLGPDNPVLAEQYGALGWALVQAGEVDRGLAQLERGAGLVDAQSDARVRSRVRFALAQTLWEHRPDERARAVQLARRAETDAATGGDDVTRDEIAAWRRAHAGP